LKVLSCSTSTPAALAIARRPVPAATLTLLSARAGSRVRLAKPKRSGFWATMDMAMIFATYSEVSKGSAAS
jgi:hypothetical protein